MHESTHHSCLASTVQAAGGDVTVCVTVWGIISSSSSSKKEKSGRASIPFSSTLRVLICNMRIPHSVSGTAILHLLLDSCLKHFQLTPSLHSITRMCISITQISTCDINMLLLFLRLTPRKCSFILYLPVSRLIHYRRLFTLGLIKYPQL